VRELVQEDRRVRQTRRGRASLVRRLVFHVELAPAAGVAEHEPLPHAHVRGRKGNADVPLELREPPLEGSHRAGRFLAHRLEREDRDHGDPSSCARLCLANHPASVVRDVEREPGLREHQELRRGLRLQVRVVRKHGLDRRRGGRDARRQGAKHGEHRRRFERGLRAEVRDEALPNPDDRVL
jgi:hypothetical protein